MANSIRTTPVTAPRVRTRLARRLRSDAAAMAYAIWTSSVRAFAIQTKRVSYRRRVSRQMSSLRGVSGHLPSGRSARLTDAECQGKCLPYEVCQGICHPDAARVLQTQSVKANVVRTTHATASAFWTRSVRPFAIRTHRVSYRRRVSWQFFPDGACQGKCRLDKAYDGVPHIGNRAVTVIASRRDCHGTVHCSEDYQTCIWFQAL